MLATESLSRTVICWFLSFTNREVDIDVYLNVNIWMWRHVHTLEANLIRSQVCLQKSELHLNTWHHITQELVISRIQNPRQCGNLNLPYHSIGCSPWVFRVWRLWLKSCYQHSMTEKLLVQTTFLWRSCSCICMNEFGLLESQKGLAMHIKLEKTLHLNLHNMTVTINKPMNQWTGLELTKLIR